MYRYMSAGEETPSVKKIVQNEYISKSDLKYRKIYLKACNPPENIVRGTEGLYKREYIYLTCFQKYHIFHFMLSFKDVKNISVAQ